MYEENFAVAILDVAADRSVALGASAPGPAVYRSDVAWDAGETVVLPYIPYAIQANWTFWVCHTKWVKKGDV